MRCIRIIVTDKMRDPFNVLWSSSSCGQAQLGKSQFLPSQQCYVPFKEVIIVVEGNGSLGSITTSY